MSNPYESEDRRHFLQMAATDLLAASIVNQSPLQPYECVALADTLYTEIENAMGTQAYGEGVD